VATIPHPRAAPLAPRYVGPRFPILDGYIARELVIPFVLGLLGFFLFWFINIFFVAADYIINAHAPVFLILRFMFFRVPQSTPYAFPFACLLATMLAMGRLAADNELTALRTSGVKFSRIARTPLIFGAAMFALSFYVNEEITPKSVDLSTRTFYQIVYHTSELPIIPGFFRKDDSTERMFYVGNVSEDRKTLKDVMIFEQATNGPFRTVETALEARIVGATLELQKARISRFKPTGEAEVTIANKDIQIPLPLGENSDSFINSTQFDPYTTNTKKLSTQISAMQATGQGGQALDQLKFTLAQKYALPFASLIAVMLSLPLAVVFGRRGRVLGAFMSLAMFFAYYLLLSAFGALGKNESVDPYLAAWIPNIVMVIASAALFWKVER
jgi:lipopolysaccharide export system permease protein